MYDSFIMLTLIL